MRRLALLLVPIVALALGACSAPSMDDPHVPVAAAPLDPSSEDVYDIPIDALEEVMRFAMWEMHWGPTRIVRQSQGLYASAVRPNGRSVEVHAQATATGEVRVQVVAGHFGDPDLERAFHRELAAAVERWRDRAAADAAE